MESELERQIRWHLTDLSFKAPEVSRPRTFRADGHLVDVMADGRVFVDNTELDRTEIDRIRKG